MEVWLPVVVVTRDPESRSQLEEETLALEAEVTCAHNTATVASDPGSVVNKNVRMNSKNNWCPQQSSSLSYFVLKTESDVMQNFPGQRLSALAPDKKYHMKATYICMHGQTRESTQRTRGKDMREQSACHFSFISRNTEVMMQEIYVFSDFLWSWSQTLRSALHRTRSSAPLMITTAHCVHRISKTLRHKEIPISSTAAVVSLWGGTQTELLRTHSTQHTVILSRQS